MTDPLRIRNLNPETVRAWTENIDPLFDDSITLSDSPKIRWLKKHNLRTAKDDLPRAGIGPFDTKPFRCSNPARTVNFYGETEEEAIGQACEALNIKHWLLE